MDTNIKYLVDNNINIWNKDAYNYYIKEARSSHTTLSFDNFIDYIKKGGAYVEDKLPYSNHEYILGDIGRGYGAQLRDWINTQADFADYEPLDQFAELINTLKTNPMATKKTVTFWNPAEKDQCALTPCHWSFEILVEPLSLNARKKLYNDKGNFISTGSWGMSEEHVIKEYHKEYDRSDIPKYQFTLKWHQHSVDSFLGLPFNIASYALLAQIIGKMTNMVPKGIIGDLSNVHIYEPHLDAVKEQLSRDVNKYGECKLQLGNLETYCEVLDNTSKDIGLAASIDSMLNLVMTDLNDIKLKDYKSYPRIPAEMLAYNN